MIRNAKFVHTNIVANDWKALADFYQKIFGCEPVPPERDYAGDAIDSVTGIPGARIHGIHLRLPGYDNEGPTLEIFQYEQNTARGSDDINAAGFAHIAFAVESVEEALAEMIAEGGSAVGETVTLTIATGAKVTLVYARDPEGNIVELQAWTNGD